ncbi:PrpR N-terminal domain-containing protein [Streptococcus sobrinus]|uniref:PrpR N-terminal domain-containing protein n=1 Tax=Streptococcus sobrinus TaxID=1310 RepID=UPI00030D76A1|nr:PrpR N-terminal domain-containing protein [Streptococcus sobrinus]
MMPTVKVLGTAPYRELQQSMSEVSKQFPDIEIDTCLANLDSAKEIVKSVSPHQYDAILSRGGTADLIKDMINIPVIDVSISL